MANPRNNQTVPFSFRLTGHNELAAGTVRMVDIREAVSIEIGADSLVDSVYVTPKNGQEYMVAVGAPLPFGEWEGPFAIRHHRVAGIAYSDKDHPSRLSLDFLPCVAPTRTRRAPFIHTETFTINGTPGTTIRRWPVYGRERTTIGLNYSGGTLTYELFAICRDGSVQIVQSLYSGTTTTDILLAVDAENVEWLELQASAVTDLNLRTFIDSRDA